MKKRTTRKSFQKGVTLISLNQEKTLLERLKNAQIIFLVMILTSWILSTGNDAISMWLAFGVCFMAGITLLFFDWILS